MRLINKTGLAKKKLFWLFALIIIFFIMRFVFRLVIVQGDSMSPALSNGDIVVLWLWNYLPKEGDIVVTTKKNPFYTRMIKRIVTIGGSSGSVIPEGRLFLQGDNAGQSRDSREISYLPDSIIMGQVIARLFPRPELFYSTDS